VGKGGCLGGGPGTRPLRILGPGAGGIIKRLMEKPYLRWLEAVEDKIDELEAEEYFRELRKRQASGPERSKEVVIGVNGA